MPLIHPPAAARAVLAGTNPLTARMDPASAPLTPLRLRASHGHPEKAHGETLMQKAASALLGSLLINLVLGLSMAAVLAASAATAPPPRCGTAHAPARPTQPPARPAPAAPGHNGYVVAARMGWAMG